MEQSVPGERGVLVPRPSDEVAAEVGDPLQYVPAAMRRAAAARSARDLASTRRCATTCGSRR